MNIIRNCLFMKNGSYLCAKAFIKPHCTCNSLVQTKWRRLVNLQQATWSVLHPKTARNHQNKLNNWWVELSPDSYRQWSTTHCQILTVFTHDGVQDGLGLGSGCVSPRTAILGYPKSCVICKGASRMRSKPYWTVVWWQIAKADSGTTLKIWPVNL